MAKVENLSRDLTNHVMVPTAMFAKLAAAYWGPGGPAYHGTEQPLGQPPPVIGTVSEGGSVSFIRQTGGGEPKPARGTIHTPFGAPQGYHPTGYQAVRDAAKKVAAIPPETGGGSVE